MPANLTHQYIEAESNFRQAQTVGEKRVALEQMLATIPKHKGTDKMQGDIKKRLAKLRQEEQRQSKKGAFHDPFVVDRHGAGQVVVIGRANVGKSRLVAVLTGAPVEVADYPYTTQLPSPAMMTFEDVQIQLVDTPPLLLVEEIDGGFAEMVRRADLVLLVCDLGSDDVLEHIESVLLGMESRKVRLASSSDNGALEEGVMQRVAVIVGNKSDEREAGSRWDLVCEFYGKKLPCLAVSAESGERLDDLRRIVFDCLNIVRVYSKPPRQKPDLEQPFVLKRGSTVLDLARSVHREFVDRLELARVWGSAEHDGQPVSRGHVLRDGDVVELHI